MATGMKAWVGIVATAFAAVALSALPPRPLELSREDQLAEQIHFDAVNDDVRRAHAALRATRWSAKLAELAARAPANGLVLGPPVSGRFTDAGVDEWRQARVRAFEVLERRDQSVVVGVIWQPSEEGAIEGLSRGPLNEPSIFVGTTEGTPYCFSVRPYGAQMTDVLLGWDGSRLALGACRSYAVHGMAGLQVQSWLEAGAMGFAAEEPGVSWASITPDPEGREPLFGLRQYPFSVTNIEVDACLAGRAAACLAAVTDPGVIAWPDQAYVAENSPLSYIEQHGGQRAPFSSLDDDLLLDLESEFGAEAFGRFWRSDQSVPAAFHAAFGMEMGDWLVGWVESEIGLRRAGPAIPGRSLVLGFVTLTLLTMAATLTVMRREVG